MRSPLRKQEIIALAELRKAKLSGESLPPMPSQIAGKLTSHRFAQPDEYGGLAITERGEQHIRELLLSGAPVMRPYRDTGHHS